MRFVLGFIVGAAVTIYLEKTKDQPAPAPAAPTPAPESPAT